MKYIHLAFVLLLGFLAACDSSDDVHVGQAYVATIVGNEPGQVVLEIDGSKNFYTAAKLRENQENLELGDRLLLHYFEINYDDQIEGSNGSLKAPYHFSTLIYQGLETYSPVMRSPETDEIKSDEIPFFNAPYLKKTVNGDVFMNFYFNMRFQDEQKYNFIINRVSNDTIYAEFKTTYKDAEQERLFSHIETFKMEDIPSKGVFNIKFNAKMHEPMDNIFINPSTCILKYNLD